VTAAPVPAAARPVIPAQRDREPSGQAGAPRLAPGTELLGEYKDSGYQHPPPLVRWADGQVIQMSRLLYLVASRIDGSRDLAAIARLVSDDLGRTLNAGQVGYLITAKLTPLGIIAGPGAPAVPPKANPPLALRARATLLPEHAANAVCMFMRPLFRRPVMAAVGAIVAAVDYWLFASGGLAVGLRQVLRDPVGLLVVLALTLASAAFHECGHAAACRYGGARPGRIGAGIYLVWPSFFTNVTDSYRLGRAGRLRTDLGGLYFNLIFILALYAATSAWTLLLVIALTHLEMLEQLLPFARFDGYYILSDLTGVPDLLRPRRPHRQRDAHRPGRPAHRWPDTPDPDHRNRLGALRHPVAHGHHRIPAAAASADQPGALARGDYAGTPDGGSRQRPPVRRGGDRRDRRRADRGNGRRHALHHRGAGAARRGHGSALVRGPASPPRPRRRGRAVLPSRPRRVLDRTRPVPRLVSPPAAEIRPGWPGRLRATARRAYCCSCCMTSAAQRGGNAG